MVSNPFSFARTLLTYIKGEDISEVEKKEVEGLIKQKPSICALYNELKSKDKISEQLALINKFDKEAALKKIKDKKIRSLRIKYLRVAAAVVVTALLSLSLLQSINKWSKVQTYDMAQIGSGVVTLKTSEGSVYTLNSDNKQIITDNNFNFQILKEQLVLTEKNIHKNENSINNGTEANDNIINAPYRSSYIIVLPDGTRVTLNSGSSLHFPSSFGDGDRTVRLEGEAYFDVTKVEGRRFVVLVNDVAINVLGTQFDVKSYSDEKNVYTTLVKGSITFEHNGQTKQIVPGEQVVYDKDVQSIVIKTVNTEQYTSWTNKMFYFENTSLDDILRQLSRWYGLDIEYTKTRLNTKEIYYSGKVKMYDHPIDILRKFEKSGELKFDLKSNTVIITDK